MFRSERARIAGAWIGGIAAFWIAVVMLCVLIAEPAAAAPDGLYFEQRAEAGGVEVRRMRDVGEGVVCYVAKGPPVHAHPYGGTSIGVSVSCVKVDR